MYGGVLLTSLLIIVSAWALRNRHQLGGRGLLLGDDFIRIE